MLVTRHHPYPRVEFHGDQVIEYDESFAVNLSSGNQAWGTIVNDDGVLVNIDSVDIYEGDYGTTIVGFTVWLSEDTTSTWFGLAK